MKSTVEEFVSDPLHRKAFEQEALKLEATELICELMEKEGAGKADLAKKVGCSRAHITQTLDGRNLTLATISDFALALGYRVKLTAERVAELKET